MTRLERESLHRLLAEIATAIEGAEARSEQMAKAYAESQASTTGHWPYQVGLLCALNNEQARKIRAAIETYLAPKGKRRESEAA